MISFSTWLTSSCLALIPLLPSLHDYFVDQYHYTDNPILLDGSRQAHIEFLKNYHQFNESKITWDALIMMIKDIFPKMKNHPRPMSYYSKHGVCLPKLFTTRLEHNWHYPFFMMLADFTTFLYVLATYFLTYKITASKARNRKNKMNLLLQKKIARLIVADFCCWVPVCTAGNFLCFSLSLSLSLFL